MLPKADYFAREVETAKRQQRLALIHAQYQIACITGKPATLTDLAMMSLQISPEQPAAA